MEVQSDKIDQLIAINQTKLDKLNEYNKLWKLLIDKNMKKKDLRLATGMSTTALAKLGRNEHINTEILTKICEVLDCDFCDIIELVKEEQHD